MRLDPDGAQRFPAAFTPAQISSLECVLPTLAADRPGMRLNPPRDGEGDHAKHGGGGPALKSLLTPATEIAATFLGPKTRPVRATLFDKSAARNWSLGWHQDRTIAARARIDTPGFTGWTVKHGIAHAVPPFDYLQRMLTARIHLDPVGSDNAPLLIAPGSHRLGRIAEPEIPAIAKRLGEAACPAERGDLWLYATPLLHASARAERPARRRVLQILYSADDLPGGLEWLGV